jgi:hypothetical protein
VLRQQISRLAVEYWQSKESKEAMRMRKTLVAIVAAATLALASVAVPQDAQARGGRLAAGIIGGLAAGAILGAAASQGPYYYGPGPYYYGPGPVYYAPDCYWTHERWWNGWRWRWRRVRVCN